jgi:hypothetical protein
MGIAKKQRTKRKGAAAYALILLVLLFGDTIVFKGRSYAAEGVPPSRQVVIIMRALAYDANLKARAGDTINIAILHKKGHAGSEQMAVTMAKAFSALESTQVNGLPIVISRIAYSGADALKKLINGSGIDLIYVCDGFEAELDAIKEIARQNKVLTVGNKQSQIEKGLSLGVFEIDSKCTILLNLTASRLEGIAFGADLLRLAKVIR